MLHATIVLSNTFWSTGALLPEIHFVDLLVNNSSCDACCSSYSGFSSLWGCKSLSPHYISLRAAGISVLFRLASSQSLCLALSLPDSLQGSPYCEGLGEERGGPQPNEDTSFLPAFLTTAGGGRAVVSQSPSWGLQGHVLEENRM